MTVKPLHDNIFVEKDKLKEERSPGGIVIPNTEQRPQPDTATVMAVGPGRILEDGTWIVPSVKVGDRIVLDRFAGHQVHVDLDEYMVVNWSQVLAVIPND